MYVLIILELSKTNESGKLVLREGLDSLQKELLQSKPQNDLNAKLPAGVQLINLQSELNLLADLVSLAKSRKIRYSCIYLEKVPNIIDNVFNGFDSK